MIWDELEAEKKFIKQQIMKAKDPEATMANYKACIARINSKEHYDAYANSGFFTLVRRDENHLIVDESLEILAAHFKLKK